MSQPAWVSRREFLKKTGAMAAAGVAGLPILAACGGGASAPAAATSAPAAAAPTAAAAAAAPTAAGAAAAPTAAAAAAAPTAAAAAAGFKFAKRGEGDLHFVGWQYHPEVVEENVKLFSSLYNEHVNYELVAADYHPVAETKFIGGERIEMCYSEEDHLNRWFKAGWIRDIEDFPGIKDMKTKLIDYSINNMSNFQGRLTGLPYYSGFMTFSDNQELLDKGGIKAPDTWDDVIKASEELKAKNISKYPFLGDWAKDWWAISWETFGNFYSEGLEIFDKNNNPTFKDDPGFKKTLERYKYIWDKQLTVPDAFTIKDPNVTMATGEHAFYQNHDYMLRVVNEPTFSKAAGKIKLQMYPGSKKTTYAWTAMYFMGSQALDEERTWNLMQFFGGKNKEGNYVVAKKWVIISGLGTPWKEVLDDPEVKAAYAKWTDPELKRKQQEQSRTRDVDKTLWFPEWDTGYAANTQDYIQGKLEFDAYVKDLHDKASSLNSKYKLS